jgi:hypothetical protein
MSTGWNRAAEVGGNTGGSGRSRGCRTRGEFTRRISREARAEGAGNRIRGASGPFGPLGVGPRARGAHKRGKTLRTHLETGEGREGCSESKQLLPSA